MNQTQNQTTIKYSGDFNLLPAEIWDYIYLIKKELEVKDTEKAIKISQQIVKQESNKNKLIFNSIRFNQMGYNLTDFNEFIKLKHADMSESFLWCEFFNLLKLMAFTEEERDFLIKIFNQKRPRSNNIDKFNDMLYEKYIEFDGFNNIIRAINIQFGLLYQIDDWTRYIEPESQGKYLEFNTNINSLKSKLNRIKVVVIPQIKSAVY